MSDQSWRVRAACSGSDPELFQGTAPSEEAEAKRVCAHCRVRQPCRDFAVGDSTLVGVWGGTTTRERAALRRASR